MAVLFIFLFLVFCPIHASAQDFIIHEFHSEITINKDSSITVEETIEVEFFRPRHGIYREIPYKYKDELGKTTRTPIKVQSVRDVSGNKWKYRVQKQGSVINIRIGDAQIYVTGKQTYVITYKVDNALLFFNDHDELYWNVTGNYWRAQIKKASAKIVLLTEKVSDELWAACYTGYYGSRERNCEFRTSGHSVEFFARRELNPEEGFTIAFGWQKGIVSPPSSLKKFLIDINLEENWVFIFPLFSFLFIFNLWHRKGRDPQVRQTITVMYEPPRYNNLPLNPAEVGTLIDEKIDGRDITATIVGLAVKGYLKIEEIEREGLIFDTRDYYLKKLKGSDDELSDFEKLLMKKLFPAGAEGILVSELKNKFYIHLSSLKDTLYNGLVKKGYFLVNPEKIRQLYIISGIVVSFIGLLAGSFLVLHVQWKGIVAGILTGLPVLLFSGFMPAKTRAGAMAYMHVLGFREFMNRAEKDRIERIGDKDLFSRFLPYAIALDVVDNWAGAFEGIYQNPPEWYVSQRGFRIFEPANFSRSISSMSTHLGSVIFSAPRGSGVSGSSGGGGFSGGGTGGGGGGSW
ncbi:MAG: DUF2207 domain-containing protein [Thermodesulfovibrionales bacterium]